MKWYGFILIFLTASAFCNFLYTVRLNYAVEKSLIVQNVPLPEGKLQIMDRSEGTFLSAETMPRQPLILFFFASWCRPCQIEAPIIAKLSERHDVPFIGIAVRDPAKKVRSFLEKGKNPYQFVALDPDLRWTTALRADSLPTAFIINGKGNVAAKINGIMTEDFYIHTVLPFLKELQNEIP